MKVWQIQSVLSPYRIKLFERIAKTAGVEFRLVLLRPEFKTRPQWNRSLNDLPFEVGTSIGFGYRVDAEQEAAVNPFLLFALLKERPSVVICEGCNLATVSVFLYSKLFGGKYVIGIESTADTDRNITKVKLWIRKLLMRHASAFVDAGTLSREYVRMLGPDIRDEQMFRAYNCVDNEQFMITAPESVHTYGGPNLLFVGRLTEQKGLPQLVEVYRRTLARYEGSLGLTLIGEGPLAEQIERHKIEHSLSGLRLLGWLKNDATAKYYASADAFVFLSLVDRNPLVLFEALAAGVPLIFSARAGNAIDFIEDGKNGYIVDPENLEQVTTRILEVLAWDSTRRADCRRFSREIVRKANYDDAARAIVDACRYAVAQS